MKLSLRNRILVPVLALVVLVVLVIGSVSYYLASRSIEAVVDDIMAADCEASIDQIEIWTGGQRDALVVLAAQNQSLTAIGTSEGAKDARAGCSADLQRLETTCGFYEDLHLIDAQGLARASSNPASVDKLDVSDRQYFKDAMGGNVVVSEVLKSRTTGNPIVVIAAPVKQGGETAGVLIGVLDLNWFSTRFIANVRVLETGYVFVHDRAGVFIAHPNTNLVLNTKLADFPWGPAVLNAGDGLIHYTYEGVAKTAVFRKMKDLGWGVVATVPVREERAAVNRLAAISAGLGGVFLVVAAALVVLLVRSIARPIKTVADVLAGGSDETTAAAGQVAGSSQSLAEGASEQAASLEETSASLEELASMTRRNGESTVKAGDVARTARLAADCGVQDMQRMSEAMAAIQSSSNEVGKIIRTIDEIAFQTNILALNAAVEAARAGEAGAGFAVVADEVRNLAQRSAQAAKETATKIESAIGSAAQGVELSAKVAQQLEDIVLQVRQMDALMGEITSASREQTQGIEQITTAVSQMDQVTQRNAASAEECASAAEELNAQAESLRGAVGDLKRLVEGAARIARTESATPARPETAGAGRKPQAPGRVQPGGNGQVGSGARNGDRTPAGLRSQPTKTEETEAGFTSF